MEINSCASETISDNMEIQSSILVLDEKSFANLILRCKLVNKHFETIMSLQDLLVSTKVFIEH